MSLRTGVPSRSHGSLFGTGTITARLGNGALLIGGWQLSRNLATGLFREETLKSADQITVGAP